MEVRPHPDTRDLRTHIHIRASSLPTRQHPEISDASCSVRDRRLDDRELGRGDCGEQRKGRKCRQRSKEEEISTGASQNEPSPNLACGERPEDHQADAGDNLNTEDEGCAEAAGVQSVEERGQRGMSLPDAPKMDARDRHKRVGEGPAQACEHERAKQAGQQREKHSLHIRHIALLFLISARHS